MDTTQTTTHIGLCAGYGGIELGLKRVIPDLRTVALCEIEAFACANLVAKMEAGLMDAAPIWSDLKTFPWAEFRGKVDILTGGYPCQPFSAAGKRAGKDDPRHLWPWIADGIRLLQPRCCFFENVEGHITLGLSTVISDLEEMGYRTTWGIFSASEVGAPHQRKRVFILAYDQRQRIEELGRQIAVGSQQHSAWDDGELVNANGVGSLDEQQSAQGRGTATATQSSGTAWPSRPGEPQHGWEPPRVVADSNLPRIEAQWNESNCEWKEGLACEPSELGNANSTRSQERSWQRGAGLQGTDADGREDAEWETEPPLGRDANGCPSRMDDAIVFASDCRPCECCDDVICWRCQEHYADCPCPGPNSSDD